MIGLLESVWASLADLGAGFADDDWNRPTDCPGWSVRDQFAHMIGTESMLDGRAAPEVELPAELAHVRNDIGRFNEQWVESMRGRSGSEVLADFVAVTAARLDALRAMTAEQWDEEGFTPEGPGPYRQFMAIRVFDCWFHEQDVREAVDRPGGLEGPVADFALARIPAAMGYVVGKKAGAPEGSTVAFSITGESAIDFAVGVEGRARLLDAVPAAPTVRLTMDRRTFSRLAGGRRSGAWALDGGLVAIAGDDALGRAIVEHLGYTI